MRHITITRPSDELMKTVEGKEIGSIRTWVVKGQLEIHLSGSYKDHELDQARALAFAVCHEMHIPTLQLVQVSRPKTSKPATDPARYSNRLF